MIAECINCGHFVAAHSGLCSACGTPRGGVFSNATAAHQPHARRAVSRRRLVSLPAKIAWIFIFSVGVAMISWKQRYGEIPTTQHIDARFLEQMGSYFVGSMPFAIIPRSAGLIFGVGVLVVRALLT